MNDLKVKESVKNSLDSKFASKLKAKVKAKWGSTGKISETYKNSFSDWMFSSLDSCNVICNNSYEPIVQRVDALGGVSDKREFTFELKINNLRSNIVISFPDEVVASFKSSKLSKDSVVDFVIQLCQYNIINTVMDKVRKCVSSDVIELVLGKSGLFIDDQAMLDYFCYDND